MHSHRITHALLLLVSLGVSLVLGIQAIQASTLYSKTATKNVGHRSYYVNTRKGNLYRLVKHEQQVGLISNHQFTKLDNATWTKTKQTSIIKHGHHYRYYFIKNRHGLSGWIWSHYLLPTSVHLNVPLVGQLPQLPTGCEITATTMMLKYQGSKVNKMQLAKEMPRSSDPNKGFVGNPAHSAGPLLCVYPGGIMSVVRHHTGHAINMTGASIRSIKKQLAKKHPVVAWVSRLDGFRTHSITLSGYSPKRIYFNDPWTRKRTSLTNHTFQTDWRLDRYRALSY